MSIPAPPSNRHGLTDSRLVVRCCTLLAVAVVVFTCCWTLAYLVFPVGVLRGRTGGAALAGGDRIASSFSVEIVRIFAVNVGLVTAVVVAPNLLRTRRGVPMGYWSAITMIAVAAVVTGTNSFSIRVNSGEKLAPSWALLGNPGPCELAAYVVAATAAYGLGRWQLVGRWPRSTAPRLAPEPTPVRISVLGLCSAVAILLAMAVWEAHRILAAGT